MTDSLAPTDIVIPACDEAATVGAVVTACLGAPGVGMVLVVVNGTDNGTSQAAQSAGAVTTTEPRADKGNAMRVGLSWVTSERVLFCDADLGGLTSDHVAAMLTLAPLSGQVAGLTDTPAVGLTRLLPPITGTRRLPTALARRLPLEGSGYGTELRIDAVLGRLHVPHRTVVLRGVTNPTRAVRNPLRFLKMVGSVAGASLYLAPELLAYERGGLG